MTRYNTPFANDPRLLSDPEYRCDVAVDGLIPAVNEYLQNGIVGVSSFNQLQTAVQTWKEPELLDKLRVPASEGSPRENNPLYRAIGRSLQCLESLEVAEIQEPKLDYETFLNRLDTLFKLANFAGSERLITPVCDEASLVLRGIKRRQKSRPKYPKK